MTEAEKEPRHLLFCFRVCGHMISGNLVLMQEFFSYGLQKDINLIQIVKLLSNGYLDFRYLDT